MHIFTSSRIKILKKILIFLLIFIFILLLLSFVSYKTFTTTCKLKQPQYAPVLSTISPDISTIQKSIDGYLRTEETTYITFPEWYLVFSPQEYGRMLQSQHSSKFPYLGALKQFWSSYCEMYGITSNHYPPNPDNHMVEVVIGVSTTFEYGIKGIYENTIGRLTELTVEPNVTKEDILARDVAIAYGNFIPTTPWYEFPYGQAFSDLWTKTDFFGPHFIRKTERKFFLSIEYGVKAIYAKIIQKGTQAKFGTAVTQIYARVEKLPTALDSNDNIKKIMELSDGTEIITVPHYQGFTDEVPKLSKLNLKFLDVAGNDEILLSVVSPHDWQYSLDTGAELFSMPILTESHKKRVLIQVPIQSMSFILNSLADQDIVIEHLFDY